MAIAFDFATDGGNNGGSSTSLTFSHTCTGTDRILIVHFIGDSTPGNDDVVSVTYNGVGMTLVAKQTDNDLGRYHYVYILANPASGANNVVIICSNTHYILGGAASYTGAAQSGQPDNTGAALSPSIDDNSLTTSLTPSASDCWVVLCSEIYSEGNMQTAGTGATRRTIDALFGDWAIFDSNGSVTAGAPYSMTTNTTGNSTDKIGHIILSIKPATGGSSGNPWNYYAQAG